MVLKAAAGAALQVIIPHVEEVVKKAEKRLKRWGYGVCDYGNPDPEAG